MDDNPRSVIRAEIRALSAYHVPDSRGLVKLDAMENPYALPPELRAELGRLAAAANLNRYPDASAGELKARLHTALGLSDGLDLLLGNGSDELIQILALAVARPGAVLLGVDPSFVMFRMIATFAGLTYVGVPLAADFSLDAPRLLAAVEEHRPALTFIAYPNNPTGNLFDADTIKRVIQASPGLVVVDEAYHAFADRSFVPELTRLPNVLVMRTLSKLGLAGLRLGMLIGTRDWLLELDKLRLPYNVNVLTQLIAARVLEHPDVLERQAAAIRSERMRLWSALSAMAGIRAYPSDANFILFRVSQADAVFNGLKARGVLIKNLNGSHVRLSDCLRVTIGTPEENGRFLDALAHSLPRAA